MALRTSSHFACVVVAGVSAAVGMRIVSYPHRPGSGTPVTRSTCGDGCHEVIRRLRRDNVGRVRTIMIAIVTALTCRKSNYGVIHCRIGEGTARVRMAVVTIDFRTRVHNWNVWTRIRVIGDIHHIGSARRMATRSLAATGHSGVIEARGRSKCGRRMAPAAIFGRNNMVWLCTFTQSAEDGAVVTVHT